MSWEDAAWQLAQTALISAPEGLAWIVVLATAALRVRGISLGFVVGAATMYVGSVLPWLAYPVLFKAMLDGELSYEVFPYLSMTLTAFASLMDSLTLLLIALALVFRRSNAAPPTGDVTD